MFLKKTFFNIVLLIILQTNDVFAQRALNEPTKEFYGQFIRKKNLEKNMQGNVLTYISSTTVREKKYYKAQVLLFKSLIYGSAEITLYGEEDQDGNLVLYDYKLPVMKKIKNKNDYIDLLRFFTGKNFKNTPPTGPFDCHRIFNIEQKKIEVEKNLYDYRIKGMSYLTGNCSSDYIPISLTESSFAFNKFIGKALKYVYITFILNLIQIFLLIRQINFSNTAARLSKINPMTILGMGFIDSFVILIHVFLSIIYQKIFHQMMLVVITEFIIFSVLDMKISILMMSNDDLGLNPLDEMRSRLGKLYLKFCTILILSTMVLYTERVDLFSFFFCSFWIPQIVHNVINNVNKVFQQEFIVGISLCKFAFFAYYYGINKMNVFKGEESGNYFVLFLLFLYLTAQIALLILMDKYGPRFFIPLKWQPKKYDYFKPIPNVDLEANKKDCSICFCDLLKEKQKDIMVTPCDHSFHTACLSRWMDQQLKCPICRSKLPSIVD